MHVAFLCGSAEFGRDGVADYCRRLAAEFVRSGVEVTIIGINDRWLESCDVSENSLEGIDVLRLPKTLAWEARTKRAASFLSARNVDWLSIQFVPYAFDDRGLPKRFVREAPALARERKRHLMFHELWLGENRGASFKERAIGLMQRRLVANLVERVGPATIHTSNPVYQEMLRRRTISAEVLSLPGNIPIEENAGVANFEELLSRRKTLDRGEKRSELFALGCFGSIHPEWRPDAFLERVIDRCKSSGKRLCFLAGGRIEARGKAVWERLAARYGAQVKFETLGELSMQEVSAYLRWLDIGVATSPWSLIGKSGTVAAMLDHGLPVVVTRNEWSLRRGDTPSPKAHPLLHRFSNHGDLLNLEDLVKRDPHDRCPEIARKMLGDLRA